MISEEKIGVIKDIKHSVHWVGYHTSQLQPGQLVEIYRTDPEVYAVFTCQNDIDSECGWLVPHESVEIIGKL